MEILTKKGGTQIRTEDQGFAIQCLNHLAIPPRRNNNY